MYQVIDNGVKNIECVSLTLNYAFEITDGEKKGYPLVHVQR